MWLGRSAADPATPDLPAPRLRVRQMDVGPPAKPGVSPGNPTWRARREVRQDSLRVPRVSV